MSEIIKNYIGKMCVITTMSNEGLLGGQDVGEVVDLQDNWMVLKTKKGESVINAGFIVKIEEHRKKKA